MSVKVEKIAESSALGEGPHWDEKQQVLFYVDINSGVLHKYVPASGEHTKAKVDGGRVGFIVPVEGTTNQFVVGVEQTFQIVRWDGRDGSKVEVVKVFGSVDQGLRSRINDGKADPRGRVFAGTMGLENAAGDIEENQGSLYRIDQNGSITKLADKICVSNGLAWDLKENAFYYTDTFDYKIRRYDYNAATGELSNMKYIFDLKKNGINGLPDGTAIDTDGNLWVAVFTGFCVINIDPRTGKLLRKIDIPCEQVTSVAFGGPNYDVLYVTSASLAIKGKAQAPPAGCTFKVTGLGVRGLPADNFKYQP